MLSWKPFPDCGCIARVCSRNWRSMSGSPTIVRFGVFELDMHSGELRRHGVRVNLPEQPFRVLRLLLDHHGHLVTRDELRHALWADDTFVDFEHGLNAAVKRVRAALGDSAESPRFIETLPKRGYRFLAPIDLSSPDLRPVKAASGGPAPDEGADGHHLPALDEPPAVRPTFGPVSLAEAPTSAPGEGAGARQPRGSMPAFLAIGLLGALISGGALIGKKERIPNTGPRSPIRFVLPPPAGMQIPLGPANAHMAFSPDGRMIAFAAVPIGGGLPSSLYVQALDSPTAHKLADTDGAIVPCWSPDGQRLAFHAHSTGGTMQTIAVTGGTASVFGRRGMFWSGCAWGSDDEILVGSPIGPVTRVLATGGAEVPVTTLNRERRETAHVWPSYLPDGRHFTYVAVSTLPEHRAVYVGSLDGATPKRIVASDGRAVYVRPGYLLWVEKGTVIAQPFDATRLELTGAPSRVVEGVAYNVSIGHAAFAVSESGVLAYREGPGIAGMAAQLVIVNRKGTTLQRIGDVETYGRPAFSPDGRLLAAERRDRASGKSEVWLFDLVRGGVGTRFSAGEEATWPAWSPDGTRLAFVTESHRGWIVLVREVAGATDAQPLWTSLHAIGAIDWAPDARSLVAQRAGRDGRHDIWHVPVDGTAQARPIVATPFDETNPRVSPDGRWLAYVSDETGRREVYVRSMLGAGPSWRVTTERGAAPRWRGDSGALFYRRDSDVHVVAMGDATRPEPGLPRRLFEAFDPSGSADYAVDRDGQRFAFVLPANDDYARKMPPITLLINWQERLRRPN